MTNPLEKFYRRKEETLKHPNRAPINTRVLEALEEVEYPVLPSGTGTVSKRSKGCSQGHSKYPLKKNRSLDFLMVNKQNL